jgi:Domain of unknown function (DUF1707)/Domain of unknown function (DUF4190)
VSPDHVELRASDADRETTVRRLQVAAAEGRLDADELEGRLSAAYAARHCSELARLTADVTPAAAAALPARPTFVRAGPRTNGLAIASLLLGVFWFMWVGSVLAVVLGHLALKEIAASDGAQGGRAIAISGLVLGYLGCLSLLGGLLLVAV